MNGNNSVSGECCPYMNAHGTKFDDFTRVGHEFLIHDLPTNAIKVIGCNRKTQGMAVSFFGTYLEDGSIKTELRNKYIHTFKGTDQSLVATTTLGSGSTVSQRFELFNALSKGLKLEMLSTISNKGMENVKCGLGISHSNFIGGISSDLLKCPVVSADAVFRYGDFLVGGQMNCCIAKKAIESYTTGIAMIRPDFKVALKAENGFKSFIATYYQTVSSNMTLGYKATFGRTVTEKTIADSSSPVNMEIAVKYSLNPSSFVKAKLDQRGNLNLALSSIVSPGLRFVIGALVDTKNLQRDSHKMGLNIVFEG